METRWVGKYNLLLCWLKKKKKDIESNVKRPQAMSYHKDNVQIFWHGPQVKKEKNWKAEFANISVTYDYHIHKLLHFFIHQKFPTAYLATGSLSCLQISYFDLPNSYHTSSLSLNLISFKMLFRPPDLTYFPPPAGSHGAWVYFPTLAQSCVLC